MTNHPKMHTPNRADDNFAKLSALFPNAVTETVDENGRVVRAIDKDVLMQEISHVVVEGREERYQFTWPDKKKSILAANAPINKTLRPCAEESVGRDGTKGGFDSENLYIEGDNLEVLKLLQETYLGKVKMIYIDPPYNTGNDFVYEDDFSIRNSEFVMRNSGYDEDGNRLFKNMDSNGRFHTDWLNMIYPRLKVARDLLTDDGVIFISIDDNEVENLKKICNEIFGEGNSCGTISRVMKSGGAKGRFFSPNVEFILVYSKNIYAIESFKENISEDIIKKLYTATEESGIRKGEKYRPFGLYQSSLDSRPNQRYYIECPDGTFVIPPGETMPFENKDGAIVLPKNSDGCWRWSRERYLEEKQKGNLLFKKSDGVLIDSHGSPAKWNIYTKIWLSDRQEEGMVPVNLISRWENRLSKKELQELNIPFDFAKPSELIKYIISIVDNTSNDIILDFFSGSATTAHAVMQLNAEDGGNRKFIMVQLPEVTDEKSEAFKAGYKNICEIGKERIRRAGEKIRNSQCVMRNEESGQMSFENNSELRTTNYELSKSQCDLDTGFRVLKLDSSNMRDVFYYPDEVEKSMLDDLIGNVKEDRSPQDLLFQVMLDLGVLLSSDIKETEIAGKKVFEVFGNHLIACFDKNVTEELIEEVAKKKPYYFIMRDLSLEDSSVAVNFEQLFKAYSPDTVRMVI